MKRNNNFENSNFGVEYGRFENGFILYQKREYWGRTTPLFITYTLVNKKGKITETASKGMIRWMLSYWRYKYGKLKLSRTYIKDN